MKGKLKGIKALQEMCSCLAVFKFWKMENFPAKFDVISNARVESFGT